MHLLIDQGNTGTKFAIANTAGELVHVEQHADIDTGKLQHLISKYAPTKAMVSSVRQDYSTLQTLLQSIQGIEHTFFFDDDCLLPITSLYTTPKTLGKDRLAGVCGAIKIFPTQNCLIIDAGTCITYDFIDDQKNYYGGSISPGLEMRLKAMHHFTKKLPLAKLEWIEDFVGNSTQTALQTGTVYGVVNEINGFIDRYKRRWGNIKPIMCGGNTDFLVNRCESGIFAAPYLVLMGLNEILKYNLKQRA